MKEKRADYMLGIKSKGCTQGTIFLLIFCLLVLSITKRNVELRCLFLLSVLPTFALCILKLCLSLGAITFRIVMSW